MAIAVLAALALLAWYVPRRRRVGPAALATGGLVWLLLLGGLTAALAPGTSHLFTLPTLGCAAGGLIGLLVGQSHPVWTATAVTLGTVPAVILLMPLGVQNFDALGMDTVGVVAVLLTLFGLTLLPLAEPLLPAAGRPPRSVGRRGSPSPQ